MRKPEHLTDLAWALFRVPCPVEDIDPALAQRLYDAGYITAPKLGWVWATHKGTRMQLEVAGTIAPVGPRGVAGLGEMAGDARVPARYDFPPSAEWVPIEVLWNLREYDRHLTRREQVERLMVSLKAHGWVAPVIITYYQQDRTVLLGEGNHRLAAAHLLGMRWGLARVVRHMRYVGPRHHTSRKPVPVSGATPNRNGYVPADLKPSEIGLPARPLSAVDLVLDGKPVR